MTCYPQSFFLSRLVASLSTADDKYYMTVREYTVVKCTNIRYLYTKFLYISSDCCTPCAVLLRRVILYSCCLALLMTNVFRNRYCWVASVFDQIAGPVRQQTLLLEQANLKQTKEQDARLASPEGRRKSVLAAVVAVAAVTEELNSTGESSLEGPPPDLLGDGVHVQTAGILPQSGESESAGARKSLKTPKDGSSPPVAKRSSINLVGGIKSGRGGPTLLQEDDHHHAAYTSFLNKVIHDRVHSSKMVRS